MPSPFHILISCKLSFFVLCFDDSIIKTLLFPHTYRKVMNRLLILSVSDALNHFIFQTDRTTTSLITNDFNSTDLNKFSPMFYDNTFLFLNAFCDRRRAPVLRYNFYYLLHIVKNIWFSFFDSFNSLLNTFTTETFLYVLHIKEVASRKTLIRIINYFQFI